MGGTRTAGSRIAQLKEKIVHAQEKKKEFSDYLKNLKQKYHRGEISYSTFLETFYQKRNGLNLQEWVQHFDDYIKECKKEIAKERRVLTKTNFVVFLISAVLISVLIFPLMYLQPKILGFTIEDGTATETSTENSETSSGGAETPTEILEEENATETNEEEIINTSISEEINGDILQNETSPSQEGYLLPSENETDTAEEEIIETTENETQIEIPINETLINETIIDFTDGNLTVQTTQFQAILN